MIHFWFLYFSVKCKIAYNHSITEWLRLAGTSQVIWSNPVLKQILLGQGVSPLNNHYNGHIYKYKHIYK